MLQSISEGAQAELFTCYLCASVDRLWYGADCGRCYKVVQANCSVRTCLSHFVFHRRDDQVCQGNVYVLSLCPPVQIKYKSFIISFCDFDSGIESGLAVGSSALNLIMTEFV